MGIISLCITNTEKKKFYHPLGANRKREICSDRLRIHWRSGNYDKKLAAMEANINDKQT
jgi:predicted GNAT superfamily acetyltransferase